MKKKTKKLVLAKETVRSLELKNVAGQLDYSFKCSGSGCTFSDVCTGIYCTM